MTATRSSLPSSPARSGLRLTALAMVGACALWLGGCASSVKLDEPPSVSGSAPITSANMPGGNASGTGSATAVAPVVVAPADADATAGNLPRVIYFDFDSFVVKDEFRAAVEGHAKRLSAARNKKIVIEGHTDERGGREYNLALGQKRAEAVAKSLTLLGVGNDQVESVSFGEERPAVTGTDEEAWAKNRRAELKDR